MRFGLVMLPDQPWVSARDTWRSTEALGFDHAWTYDHRVGSEETLEQVAGAVLPAFR